MNPAVPQTEVPGTIRQTGKNVDNSFSEDRDQFARLLLDGISTGVLILSPEGTVLECNRAAASLLGRSAAELVGQSLAESIPDLNPSIRKNLSAAIACAGAGECSRCEIEFNAPRSGKQGSADPGTANAVSFGLCFRPLAAQSGSKSPILAEIHDATDDAAERRTDEVHYSHAVMVESSEDTIIGTDLSGIIRSWNPAAERLFGYTAEETIGQPITKIIPPELQADATRIVATIARGQRVEHFETVRLRKDGETVDVSLSVSPVRDETGKVIGTAGITRDITQLKRTERALRASERLASVGRLAASVAHEINNPLEAVTNLIFLARHSQSNEEIQKYLSMVEEELERISHLTRQTLGFYRETKGVARVRLGDIVESLLSVFAPRMRNKGIKISSDLDDSIEIFAVPGEIRQVVANLLSNSIDALDAGGKICLRVSPSAQWDGLRIPGVRVTIGDTGPGIPPAIRSRLFEPFFTTKKDVGTGLGLWISKSIVENHAGSIQVRSSTTPGKSGTTFSVFLPTPALDAAIDFPVSASTDAIPGTA
jgi:PAS domain S-box-containing protein